MTLQEQIEFIQARMHNLKKSADMIKGGREHHKDLDELRDLYRKFNAVLGTLFAIRDSPDREMIERVAQLDDAERSAITVFGENQRLRAEIQKLKKELAGVSK